jgi:hypothetical protein
MPAILIQHPEHGRTHVYNEPELAAHVALGWAAVPINPAPTRAEIAASAPPPVVTAPAPVAPPPPAPVAPAPAPLFARRGRPPKSSEGLV